MGGAMGQAAYFDCFSGISGDMTLGALVDAGWPVERLVAGLREGLPTLDGYRIEVARAEQHGIAGARLTVALDAGRAQPQRDWRQIRALLAGSRLPAPARDTALRVFATLATAEAAVHGVPVDEVHFHEVGAVDSIVDIVGVALALHDLDIERVYCSPLSDGRGFTQSQHGVIPVPAPATLAVLAAVGAPTREAPTERELVTPTGAAIVATVAEFRRPEFRPRAIGYGFGRRELPWPNALRVWLGDAADEARDDDAEHDEVVLLETNIDDMNPQFYAPLLGRLFAAGALDAFLTPIVMKKGRPATQVSVLAPPAAAAALTALLIEGTTTLGVRAARLERTKAGRRLETVRTPWGPARVKLKLWRGRVVAAMPEYDDCARLAAAHGLPVATVHAAVARLAAPLIEDGPPAPPILGGTSGDDVSRG
ncbi:MAG TPA: nickel pincer cofactor biosynthesis protein LarC [Thermomicrobiales bacterium]|nr:nickel pincer cofactor biosynthesis protein LarC [Thermomicrobiales bacterium]